MKTNVRYARRVISPQAAHHVDVAVELTAPPAEAIARPPLDAAIVVDRSGSMGGRPLEQVKAAIVSLLRNLGPDDRIAVIAFDDNVTTVLPLDRHDPVQAARRIDAIRSGGSTNLSGGWLEGLRTLTAAPREGAVRRVVTLTDGHANAGVTDRDRFSSLVHNGRGQGVTSSFIGFDDGYDEELLAALADSGGGDDYWCDGPDKAIEVFAAEFGGLARVVAQNLTVAVVPTAPVVDIGMLQDLPVVDGIAGGFTVNLGDTYGDEQRSVVLRVHVPAGLAVGRAEVAKVTLAWADVGTEVGLHSSTVPIVVTVSDDPSADDPDADPEVAVQVDRLESAKAQRDAAEAADRGEWERASELFDEAAERLVDADPAAAASLRTQSARVRQREWSMRNKKMHFSGSRSTMRGRPSDFRDAGRDMPDSTHDDPADRN